MKKLRKIINVTQHEPTKQQRDAGVFNPPEDIHKRIKELLTFAVPPSREEMVGRAVKIAELIKGFNPDAAMIGGAPYFMGILENTLFSYGIEPVYAFSRREVVEVVNDDGSVEKKAVFNHIGFVRPYGDFVTYNAEKTDA